MGRIPLSAVCMIVFCGTVFAEADFSGLVTGIGSVYTSPADIPPSNVPLVQPGCTYEAGVRFTIELTKPNGGTRQTFLYWLHPGTKAYDVIGQWLGNFRMLNSTNFSGIDWTNASGALNRLEDLLHGSSLPYWRMYTTPESLPAEVLAQLIRLRDAGMQMPCLQLASGYRVSMLNFLTTSHFLDLFEQGGLGNLTMEEFYFTPADPETVSDDQVNSVMRAIDFGFFRSSFVVECDSSVVTSALHAQPGNLAVATDLTLAVNDMCCNKVTRVCTNYVGLNCIMCSSFCCLAGVNWCP